MSIYIYEAPEVVVKRSMEEIGCDYIEYKIIEKRLFDYLVAVKDTSLDMVDKNADIVWHNYILNTKSYREFCEKYLGKFIDHEPFLNESHIEEPGIDFIAETIVKAVKEYRASNNLSSMNEGHYLYNENLFKKIRKQIKG